MGLHRSQLTLAAISSVLLLAGGARADWAGPGNGNGPPFANGGDWNGHCGWWGAGNCDGSNSNGNGNGNGNNANGSQLGFSSGELDHYNRIITIHAALACLVWVLYSDLCSLLFSTNLCA